MADPMKNENNEQITSTMDVDNMAEAKPEDKIEEQEKTETKDNTSATETKEVTANQTDEHADEKSKDLETKTENKENSPTNKTKNTVKTSKSKTNTKTAGKGSEKKEVEPLNVKLVQSHYTSHSKSTLPHILTEYGLEDKENPVVKKEKTKKKKRTKTAESGEDTDDEDKARRKAREQKFRQNFGDRPTDSHYAEYIEFLEQKVQQQRRELKEREEAQKLAAIKAREESESEPDNKNTVAKQPPDSPERQKHHFVRKLERIELKHDDTFIRSLPKTDIARIVLLQDRLKKEGKLKSQGDVDKFWIDIKKPDVFYEHFKIRKPDLGGSEPLTSTRTQENYNTSSQEGPDDVFVTPDMPPRSLSHISETSNKGTWAITQKYSSSHGPKSAEKVRKNSTQKAKDAAVDLERRCPKLEMPPLACFSLKLGDKPPDPDEILKKMDIKAREKSRKKSQRKLQKMYQMAMTNTAAANRILSQHGDLTDILEGAALRDVLAVWDEPYQSLEEYYRDLTDPSRALEVHPEADRFSQSSRGSTQLSSAGSRRLTPISTASKSSKSRRKKKKTPEIEEAPKPLPLSYNEVYTREKTVEAKCLSTMWTNYSGAGKSLFAKS